MNIVKMVMNALRNQCPGDIEITELQVSRINARLKLCIERENHVRLDAIQEQFTRDQQFGAEAVRPEVPALRCLQGGGRVSVWTRPALSLVKPDGPAGGAEDDTRLLRFKGEAPESKVETCDCIHGLEEDRPGSCDRPVSTLHKPGGPRGADS